MSGPRSWSCICFWLSNDPELMEEPLASPGKVIKRVRGSANEHFAALGEKKSKGPTPAPPLKGRGKKAEKTKPKPKPKRDELDAAEEALEKLEKKQRKKLREIDKRIEFLTKRVDVLTVVTEYPKNGTDKIFFGAFVQLEDDDGKQIEYRIVGADESDADRGYISMESPVAKALLGKRVNDSVSVMRPKGEVTFSVLSVRYPER